MSVQTGVLSGISTDRNRKSELFEDAIMSGPEAGPAISFGWLNSGEGEKAG